MRMKNLGMLLLGLVLLAPAGWAHDDNDNRRRDVGRGRDAREYGIDRGYLDGVRHGQEDRVRRAGYNYRSHEWRKADRGYDKYMGAKGQYKQGYRDGYQRGYDEAYYGRSAAGGWGNGRNDDGRPRRSPRSGYPDDGYPGNGYPGNGGYDPRALVQVAQDRGYRGGVHYAQMDRDKRNAYNPTGAKGYRDADDGYDKSLGSKADFQRIYREAFVRGYQQTYGSVGYRR